MREDEAAQCPRCDEPMRPETVRTAIWLKDELFVVENIPAQVCSRCMEQFYDEETTDRLRRLAEERFASATPVREIRVPIYSLTALLAVLLLASCGGAPPALEPKKDAPAVAAAAPFNVKSIFPEGAGRDLVLATCGACHSVICSAKGQRTAERWDAVQKSHQDKLTGQSEAHQQSMFTYLKANFNDSKPEPAVPPELSEQGCTPF